MNRAVIEGLVYPLLDCARYMNRMGLLQGAAAYSRVSRGRKHQGAPYTYEIKVAGYDQAITLRSGDSDGVIFGQVIIEQQYNLPLLDDVRVIVDCGANIGLSSLYFARRYPNATIIAIEPEPSTYAMLVRNTQHNPRIRPVQGAVWPRRTSLSILDPTRSWASMQVTEAQGTGPEGIQAVQLQDIVTEYGRMDILKVDIEGSEIAVFEDLAAQDWIRHTRAIYVELHDWMRTGCAQAFYRAISRFDFSQQHVGEVIAVTFHHDVLSKSA